MTKPVDLDALDAAQAALGKIFPDYWQEEGGDATLVVIRTVYEDESPPRGDDEESDAPWYWARNEAGWIAAKAVEILNAYPAMSSELRERRAREEAMAAELRALREVAEAARAFYGHVTEHHRTCPCCDVDDSSLCEPTCRFNAIADALAKVPR